MALPSSAPALEFSTLQAAAEPALPVDALTAYRGYSGRYRRPPRRLGGLHASFQWLPVANASFGVDNIDIGAGTGYALLLAGEPEGLELWVGHVDHQLDYPAGTATTDFIRFGGRVILDSAGPLRFVLAAGAGVDWLHSNEFPMYSVAVSFDTRSGEVLPVSGYVRFGAVASLGRLQLYGDLSASLAVLVDRSSDPYEYGNMFMWTMALGAGYVF